jgi:hypothetical protein
MNQIRLLKFEDGEDRRKGEAKEGWWWWRLTMAKKLIHLMRNVLALAKHGPTYKLTQHTRLFSHISN